MAKCVNTRIALKRLCTEDLRHTITICKREQEPVKAGETGVNTELFTALMKKVPAGIKSLRGVPNWQKVNIDEAATHLFFIKWTRGIEKLNIDLNKFISRGGKYYRVLKTHNQDEDNQYIIIEATERGDKELNAAKY